MTTLSARVKSLQQLERRAKRRQHINLALVLSLALLYIGLFPWFFQQLGFASLGFALVPLLLSVWFWRLKGGLLAVSVGTISQLVLLSLVLQHPWLRLIAIVLCLAVTIVLVRYFRKTELPWFLRQAINSLKYLQLQSKRDPLTNLLSNSALRLKLEQDMAGARRHGHMLAVLYIDIDRFKYVNDTFGHSLGDKLLQQVAERIKQALRKNDVVARIGGDEFVVALSGLDDVQEAVWVAQKLLAAMETSFVLADNPIKVHASIGISLFPRQGTDAQSLLMHADQAMHKAKASGRNNYQLFTSNMTYKVSERLKLEHELRGVLDRHELVLHYQPQMDLATGDLIGFEALLRWNHPELGLLGPADVIDIAEETGLIVPIGAWVIRKACLQHMLWRQEGYAPPKIAVNVSSIQLAHPSFIDAVVRAVKQFEMPRDCLEIELTESVLMGDVDQVSLSLETLRLLGINTSIDDFGVGYASLSYLQRLPIDKLKVDQSFIRAVQSLSDEEKNEAVVIKAIISLAHSLGQKVIVEGVETGFQLEFLRRIGCDFAQGYYLSKPLSQEAAGKLLSTITVPNLVR